MPRAALRPCSYPGCNELVEHGRCEKHQVIETKYQRDPERQRLYDRKWQAVRKRQLAAQPWCEDCLEQGIYTAATDVHHVIPHRGDKEIFLSSPKRSLCGTCHKKRKEDKAQGGALGKFPSGGCRAQVASREKKFPNVENS